MTSLRGAPEGLDPHAGWASRAGLALACLPLVGQAPDPRRGPTRCAWGLTLLTTGALVATNATVWTLLVPIFAIVTVVAAYRDHGPEVRPAGSAAAQLPG
jgi:hypothetical protein